MLFSLLLVSHQLSSGVFIFPLMLVKLSSCCNYRRKTEYALLNLYKENAVFDFRFNLQFWKRLIGPLVESSAPALQLHPFEFVLNPSLQATENWGHETTAWIWNNRKTSDFVPSIGEDVFVCTWIAF